MSPVETSPTLDQAHFERLARCIDSIGGSDFPKQIADLCKELSGADTVYVTALFENDPIEEIYSNHSIAQHRTALETYTKYAYFLDPLFQRFREGSKDELVRLSAISPDNFKNSEYFQLFYKDMGLQDECAILVRISPHSAVCFSLGVHEAGRPTKYERLALAFPAIVSVAKRHWTRLEPGKIDGTGRLAAQLDVTFNAFGTSVLSPREAEIARLILKGHSSKSIAREFDNSPETIKVHRRRLYQKLEIASQGELLSLFLSALAVTPPASTVDPLKHLYESEQFRPKAS